MADGTKSALEEANEIERKIILEGPKDPDKFKMPSGKTLTETRQALEKIQIKQGQEEEDRHSERIREQSTEGDPLYHEAARTMPGAAGTVNILPPRANSSTSEPEIAKAGDSTPAAAAESAPPPEVSTTTPSKALPADQQGK